jgi:hypothetical protein
VVAEKWTRCSGHRILMSEQRKWNNAVIFYPKKVVQHFWGNHFFRMTKYDLNLYRFNFDFNITLISRVIASKFALKTEIIAQNNLF